MHHSNKIVEISVISSLKGTVCIGFSNGRTDEFEIELSPQEASELVSDLKTQLANLSLELTKLVREI